MSKIFDQVSSQLEQDTFTLEQKSTLELESKFSEIQNLKEQVESSIENSDNPQIQNQMVQTIDKARMVELEILRTIKGRGTQWKNRLEPLVKQAKLYLESPSNQSMRPEADRLVKELKSLQESIPNLDTTPLLDSILHAQAEELDGLISILESFQTIETRGQTLDQTIQIDGHIREGLKEIRNDASERLAKGESGESIARDTSKELRNLIGDIHRHALEVVEKDLGPPPCKFCLVYLGSLAREESGPYPDLDSMMFVEDKTPEAVSYFKKVQQNVADILTRLGETPGEGIRGLRLCAGDVNPVYQSYYHRYAATADETISELKHEIHTLKDSIEHTDKEPQELTKTEIRIHVLQEQLNKLQSSSAERGTDELLTTPAQFAAQGYVPVVDTILETKINSQIDQSVDPAFGDPELFAEFQKEIDARLSEPLAGSTRKEVFVENRLKEIIEFLGDTSEIITGTLPDLFEIKTGLYRFPQIVISNLALLNDIKETNTFERLRQLTDQGVFSQDYSEKLMKVLDQTVQLRIIAQLGFGEEQEFLSKKEDLSEVWQLYQDINQLIEKRKTEILETEQELEIVEKQIKNTPIDDPFAETEAYVLYQQSGELSAKKELLEFEIKHLEDQSKFSGGVVKRELNAREKQLRELRSKLSISQRPEEQKRIHEEIKEIEERLHDFSIPPFAPRIINEDQISQIEKEMLPVLNDLLTMTKQFLSTNDLTTFSSR